MYLSNDKFTPGYKDQAFTLWYDSGKPKVIKFYDIVPVDPMIGEKPTLTDLRTWVKSDEWIERTEMLDADRNRGLQEKRLAATVEMLERHSEVGREMQKTALTWIRANKDELSPGTAVRMLVEGVSIEQATASIPDMLKKLQGMKDEDLTNEIAQLLSETPIDADN